MDVSRSKNKGVPKGHTQVEICPRKTILPLRASVGDLRGLQFQGPCFFLNLFSFCNQPQPETKAG